MTKEQKAALDLAILNLKTHGDDQLLNAIKPLLDCYESERAGTEKDVELMRHIRTNIAEWSIEHKVFLIEEAWDSLWLSIDAAIIATTSR